MAVVGATGPNKDVANAADATVGYGPVEVVKFATGSLFVKVVRLGSIISLSDGQGVPNQWNVQSRICCKPQISPWSGQVAELNSVWWCNDFPVSLGFRRKASARATLIWTWDA